MSEQFKKEVIEAYSKWARSYDSEENPALVAEGEHAIDLLEASPDKTILEIGCGTGRNLKRLSSKTTNLYGIDISPEMLAIAKKTVPEAMCSLHDIQTKTEYPDSFFDEVLCSFVISHIRNLTSFFTEADRLLNTGGHLVITTIHPEAEFSNYEPVGDRFRLMKYGINIQHGQEEIITAAEEAGLRPDVIREVPVDDLEQYFTRESYRKIRHTPFLLILRFKKV